MAEATAPLDTAIGNFMSMTAKSSVAVVVPLYGYWNDIPDNPVNGEVLDAVLKRVYSNVHHLYMVFVANPETVPNNPKDKKSVANIMLSKAQGGNVLNVAVKRDASYVEYVEEGLHAALNDTNAQFVIVLNPWVMIQDGAIDVIVDRANYGDNARVISGFDITQILQTKGEQASFDSYKNTMPTEEWDLSLNFLGMPRYVAEMLQPDTEYRTHRHLERDIWQRMFSKGFGVISSQRIPVFPFEFPWNAYEKKEDFDSDAAHFVQKWGFDPGIKYGESK